MDNNNAISKFEAELKTMTDDQVLNVIEDFITNTKCNGVDDNSKNLQLAYDELDKRMCDFDEYDDDVDVEDDRNKGEKETYDMLDRMNDFC